MAVKQKKEEQGYVLILVLLLLILMVIVTPSLFLVSTTGYATSKKDDQMQQARYLADIAYQLAWQVIQQNTTQNSGTLRVTTDESTIMQALWNIPNISPKTTDNGTYSISSYLDENYSVGKNQLATSGWPHIYYIRASGQVPKAGNSSFVTSNIDFKLIYDQQTNQIVIPSSEALSYNNHKNLYNQVKDFLAFDENAGKEAKSDLDNALQSAVNLGSVCTGDVQINGGGTTIYDRPFCTTGNVKILGGANVIFNSDFISLNGSNNAVKIEGNATVVVKGRMAVVGSLNLDGNSNLEVSGPFAAQNVDMNGNSQLNTDNGASIVNQLSIEGNATYMFRNRTVVGQNLFLNGSANLKPNGGSSTSSVTLEMEKVP